MSWARGGFSGGAPITGLFSAQSVPPCLGRPRPQGAAQAKACTQPHRSGACRTFSTTLTDRRGPSVEERPSLGVGLPATLKTCRTVSTTLIGYTHCSAAERTRSGGTQCAAQSVPLFLGQPHALRSS